MREARPPSGEVMTLQELIDHVKALQKYDLDNVYGKDPVNKGVTMQINRALRFISLKIKLYDPKVVMTLTAGLKTYTLHDTSVFSVPMVRPMKIFINGNQLSGPTADNGLYSISALDDVYPGWRNVPTGTPTHAALQPGGKMLLVPSPDSACVSAGYNWAAGYVTAPKLVNMTDIPAIPEHLHEAIAELAAEYGAQPTASDAIAWQRLASYRLNWTQLVAEEAQRNSALVVPFEFQGSRWSDVIDV